MHMVAYVAIKRGDSMEYKIETAENQNVGNGYGSISSTGAMSRSYSRFWNGNGNDDLADCQVNLDSSVK